MEPVHTAARDAIDRAHAGDPKRIADRPAEQVYADRIEAWIARLVTHPSPALALAARAQHLERWVIPRGDFPMDRAGYHRWRLAVQARQGARARDLLAAAGCDQVLAERVARLVAKDAGRGDAEAQALEDAACLAFIADELADFVASHPDYDEAKLIDIIARTWSKMSDSARTLASGIDLPPAIAQTVHRAVSG